MKCSQLVVKQLHRQVNGDLKKAQLFPDNARILVACSGGPDSMVLLEVLRFLGVHRKGHWSIGVATMNHGIRPEGASELLMVQDYCVSKGLPFYGTTIDVPTMAKEQKSSLETMGREARYRWLLEVARSEGYDYIATAHHKDDQAETILAHVVRGSGLKGLVGMEFVNHSYDIPLVRPLLSIRKDCILQYAEQQGISYCIDVSNEDTAYTRNRLRHNVVPELELINPDVVDALFRLGTMAKEDNQYIEAQANHLYEELVSPSLVGDDTSLGNATLCTVSRRALRKQPLSLQRRIWQRLCHPVQLTWAHQGQLEDIVNTGEPKNLTIRHITITAQCDTIEVYCKD